MDARPTKTVETIVVDQHGQELAHLPGVSVWPPVDATVALGAPNRTASVREVTLRLSSGHATIYVQVHDYGQVVADIEGS